MQWFVNKEIRYRALGDFEEIFAGIVKDKSYLSALGWYWLQVIKSLPAFITDSIYWSFIMFKNYFKITIRYFYRNKIFTFINIGSLAIGLALFLLIFLYTVFELNYDTFHENYQNIIRLSKTAKNLQTNNEWSTIRFKHTTADWLQAGFPEIKKLCKVSKVKGFVEYENNLFNIDHLVSADENVFNILTLPLIYVVIPSMFYPIQTE